MKITDYQSLMYKVLVAFDRFCEEQSLTYFLCGGTLLGAVRHGGFIPWDDDIDVSMPREDYEKLLNECTDLLPDGLTISHYKNTENYPMAYAKIVDSSTTVVEQISNSFFKFGVCIEVFPIDGAGRTVKEAIKRIKRTRQPLRMARVSAYPKDYLPRNTRLLNRIKFRIASLFKSPKYYDNVMRYLKKLPYNATPYSAVFVGGYRYKEIMPREFYGKPTKIKFCDGYFNAPEKTHEHLTTKFGDYMQCPPVEQQVTPHNIVFVDDKKSYLDFDLEEFKNKRGNT